jgi:tetratricopeptide (TPR) repeat protein
LLERQVKTRHDRGPRRWGPLAARASVAGVIAGLLLGWSGPAPMSLCEEQIRVRAWERGVKTCLASYARTNDPRDLAGAAKAHLHLGQYGEAEELAKQLLAGPRYGDAHAILSYIEVLKKQGGKAKVHATFAFVAHTLGGDDAGRASDAVSLSQAAWQDGDFTVALKAADEALRLARRLPGSAQEVAPYEAAAQLARADVLRRMGNLREAADALARVSELAVTPCDRAWAHLKSGAALMEALQNALARNDLEQAARANDGCNSRDVSTPVALSLARLLRRTDPDAARAAMDEVARVEGELYEVLLLRGYLAGDQGALDEADGYFVQAERLEPPDADWPWEVARARAEIAELRGGAQNDALAEAHYRRAIDMVDALRTSARTQSADFVASHRDSYDGLIALLARGNRWPEALAVILKLDASDMLRATADKLVIRDEALPPASVEDVVAAWGSRDLVIVIAPAPRQFGPGQERAYRLRIHDGQVTGEDVGDASQMRSWAGALRRDPASKDAARALGPRIVPPGPAEDTLHVLAVGALGKVPLAALRDEDGSLSIARRPLERVLGLRASSPEARGTGPEIVIADSLGDLPGAEIEAGFVAEILGVGASTLSSASRARLRASPDAAVWHLAIHVDNEGLVLADGHVAPSEVVQWRLAPRLAVLAGCRSAIAMDEEGWGSMAAALLEAGTGAVIATDRSVDDAGSRSLMGEFYAQPDWRTDPARALARVQQALAARAASSPDEATQTRLWAAFSVLGRPPVVVARAPSHP